MQLLHRFFHIKKKQTKKNENVLVLLSEAKVYLTDDYYMLFYQFVGVWHYSVIRIGLYVVTYLQKQRKWKCKRNNEQFLLTTGLN